VKSCIGDMNPTKHPTPNPLPFRRGEGDFSAVLMQGLARGEVHGKRGLCFADAIRTMNCERNPSPRSSLARRGEEARIDGFMVTFR